MTQAIDQDKEFIIAHPEYKLSLWEWVKFKYYIYKRKQNYPLAYITKKKEFYGLNFNITEDVLVPRPETEQIVDLALDQIKKIDGRILLVDIGTGSGCIPISIVKTIKDDNKQKAIRALATDIDSDAISLAKKNAKKHSVDIGFYQGNLAQPVLDKLNCYENIIITANLPYLTENQFNTEPSIQQEPRQALVAENEGLEYYEELLRQLSGTTIYDKNYTLFFEINPQQKKGTKKLVDNHTPKKVEFKKDLKGWVRVAKITS